MSRHDAVFHDALLVVNVVKKKVQRRDPLHQSAFNMIPLQRRYDSRHEVEREHPLRSARIAIDIEGHSLAQKRQVHRVAFGIKIFGGNLTKRLLQLPVMPRRGAIAPKHLVKKFRFIVGGKIHAGQFCFSHCVHFAPKEWFYI